MKLRLFKSVFLSVKKKEVLAMKKKNGESQRKPQKEKNV